VSSRGLLLWYGTVSCLIMDLKGMAVSASSAGAAQTTLSRSDAANEAGFLFIVMTSGVPSALPNDAARAPMSVVGDG